MEKSMTGHSTFVYPAPPQIPHRSSYQPASSPAASYSASDQSRQGAESSANIERHGHGVNGDHASHLQSSGLSDQRGQPWSEEAMQNNRSDHQQQHAHAKPSGQDSMPDGSAEDHDEAAWEELNGSGELLMPDGSPWQAPKGPEPHDHPSSSLKADALNAGSHEAPGQQDAEQQVSSPVPANTQPVGRHDSSHPSVQKAGIGQIENIPQLGSPEVNESPQPAMPNNHDGPAIAQDNGTSAVEDFDAAAQGLRQPINRTGLSEEPAHQEPVVQVSSGQRQPDGQAHVQGSADDQAHERPNDEQHGAEKAISHPTIGLAHTESGSAGAAAAGKHLRDAQGNSPSDEPGRNKEVRGQMEHPALESERQPGPGGIDVDDAQHDTSPAQRGVHTSSESPHMQEDSQGHTPRPPAEAAQTHEDEEQTSIDGRGTSPHEPGEANAGSKAGGNNLQALDSNHAENMRYGADWESGSDTSALPSTLEPSPDSSPGV